MLNVELLVVVGLDSLVDMLLRFLIVMDTSKY